MSMRLSNNSIHTELRAKTPRSKANEAMSEINNWTDEEQGFFIASFTSRKSNAEIADDMGISLSDYMAQRSDLLRRFMRVAQTA